MIAPAALFRARRARASLRAGEPLLRAFESSIRLLRWGLYAAIAVYLTSGITFVAPHEDAVIYRLGRRLEQVHAPGLLLALPAPIDTVVRVPTRGIRELPLEAWAGDVADTPAAEKPGEKQYAHLAAMAAGVRADMVAPNRPVARALHPVKDGYSLTADANILQGRFVARYRIRDPIAWLDHAQHAEPLLDAALYRALTQVLAAQGVDAALSHGKERIVAETRRLAQETSDRLRLGLEIDRVEIRELSPPRAVVPAFEEVVSAQVEARTAVEQARTYAANIVPKAQAEAYRLRAEADSAAVEMVARARGEAAAFRAIQAEYQAAPDLLKARLAAETRARVLPRLKYKTILPSEGASMKLFLREEK